MRDKDKTSLLWGLGLTAVGADRLPKLPGSADFPDCIKGGQDGQATGHTDTPCNLHKKISKLNNLWDDRDLTNSLA